MGKVRTESIKRVSRSLDSRFPGYFGTGFPENKEKLKSILPTSSKTIRNRVAGYITHLEKIKAKQIQVEEGVGESVGGEEEEEQGG
jgi:small subunit ribosomal protein S17e